MTPPDGTASPNDDVQSDTTLFADAQSGDAHTPLPFRLTCPICEKSVEFADRDEATSRPFCSIRCKNVDLGKWLSGEYRISEPLSEHPDFDDLQQ